MGEHHSAAAVALEIELGERLTLGTAVEEEGKVGIPLVADHLAAREAADGNDLSSEEQDAKQIREGGQYVHARPKAGRRAASGCWA